MSNIKAELQKRAEQIKVEAERPKFVIEEFCFDRQIKFIRDNTKFKTGVCSRRAGKTVSCAADLIDTIQSHDEGDVAYITLNRRSAKRIIWRQLMQLNDHFQLGAKPDHVDLTLTFPSGQVIFICGAKDEAEIEKLRGIALRKVYIDECQSFRSYIKMLIDDVLIPCLWDFDGTLCLIGTPGPIPSGYFFDAAHNPEWSNHKWTLFDNPHIERKSGKKVEEILAAERKRRGIDETDPTYRRESLGEWVFDQDALVFKFDKSKNIYKEIPEGRMEYIFGIDIGFVDADAIAVLGYSYEDKNVYLIEEWIKTKQAITPLANKIHELKEIYNPVKMVMDAGALGKKIQEEINDRHGLVIEAADKKRKFEFIKLLNDDLRTKKFKAHKGSLFEQDSYLVQWDKSNPDKLKIADTYHTDIGDAVLYAWRECRHYLYSETQIEPSRYSDEYLLQMENKEAARIEHDKNRKWYEPSSQEYDNIQEDMEDLFSDEEF